jgi:diguanylate cyclase (GGDEF)-like protein
MAVLIIDLDRFKQVNDTFGHPAGDELLLAAAQRLQQSVRKSDTVARFGGDEFVVILSEVEDRNSVDIVARKILDSLALPYVISGIEINSGSSIGISLYPSDGVNASMLMQCADVAMYDAKNKGRGKYQFFR